MRFVRENLFYVVLIALTVVIGAAELVYSITRSGTVRKELEPRDKLQTGISQKLVRREKANDEINTDLETRINILRDAAKKDVADSIEFNRKNLPVMQLKTGETGLTLAFPIDAELYRRHGLRFVFTKQYGDTLRAWLDMEGLHRTRPPTNEEINKDAQQLKETVENPQEVAKRRLTLAKAKDGMIYIDETAFDKYFLAPKAEASDQELWESQVNLWVTQELLQAIMATNADLVLERRKAGLKPDPNEANVLSSAVKRLVQIQINEPFTMAGSGTFTAGPTVGTLTRRTTTADYALVEYRLAVVMPTRHVQALLRNLMSRNYHVVVNLTMAEVTGAFEANLYYGTDPVMTVEISAEMMLLIPWIRDLMPQDVKARLPIPAEAPKPESG